MNKTTVFVIVVVIGLIANVLFKKHHSPRLPDSAVTHEIPNSAPPNVTTKSEKFKCDGRIYCSQMKSCEEATFFLKNCPGVKMDGDGDGIPCEQQWCK